MSGEAFHVFVYGTLMRGGRNDALLADARLVAAEAVTLESAYVMAQFDSSSSPGRQTPGVFKGAARDVCGHVAGEIYEVDRAGLDALDRLEQNGVRYRREEVALKGRAAAWMYILIAPDTPSTRQDRVAFDPDRRVYAWDRAEPSV